MQLYDDQTFCSCTAHAENLITLSAGSAYSKVLDSLIDDIFNGVVVPGIIHEGYYNYVANELLKSIQTGLKGGAFGIDDYRNGLLEHLQQNIYAFSGAKSLTIAKQYNAFLLDDEGKLVSKERFKSRVADVDPIFSVNHLLTERQDAIAAAQMADLWQTLKNYPALQYSTVGDGSVRPEHAALHGKVIRTDDPLLDKIIPVKDHGCRCTMLPAASSAIPSDRESIAQIAKGLDPKPYFKGNVGKEKIVYNDDHPYYQNAKGKISELQAERNYGMRSVQQIYDHNELPVISYMPNKDAANSWWMQNAKTLKSDFVVKAQNGINIKLDNEFRNHVLEDNKDDRFSFIHKTKEVLTLPDEVWAVRTKKGVETKYIKYYDDYPVIVGTNETRAFSIYQAKTGDKINVEGLRAQRKGQLLYKNENR